MTGRVLAVDPGEKRIGLAVSDPSATIANPLQVIKHVSRAEDAAAIVRIAIEKNIVQIIVGEALDDEGQPTLSARRARRLAGAIRAQTDISVLMWDESGSTDAAFEARLAMGVRRKKRSGHMDELAATIILQSYLDAQPRTP